MDPGNSVRTDRIAACTSIGKKKNDPNISDRFSFGGTESRKNAHSIISDKQNGILLPSRFAAF